MKRCEAPKKSMANGELYSGAPEREPAEAAVHVPQRRPGLLRHPQPGAGVPRVPDRPGRAERQIGVRERRVGLEPAAGQDHAAPRGQGGLARGAADAQAGDRAFRVDLQAFGAGLVSHFDAPRSRIGGVEDIPQGLAGAARSLDQAVPDIPAGRERCARTGTGRAAGPGVAGRGPSFRPASGASRRGRAGRPRRPPAPARPVRPKHSASRWSTARSAGRSHRNPPL